MKIVFIDDAVYAHLSGEVRRFCGAERQQWLLGRALASSGWAVTFGVTLGLRRGERTRQGGLEFVGIGGSRPLLNWHRFLVSERPDWWYWRGAYHLWGPGVEIAKWAGVRTIFAAAFDRDVEPRRALPYRPRWWPLYAWGLARADRIVVQHHRQLASLRSQWRSKARVVLSIAGPPVAAKPHVERAPYVAWVGMLRQPKRPDLLVEVARKAPHLHFVVCGAPTGHRSPPGFGEAIVATFRTLPNIDYLGEVAPDKAQQVMADASLLLSTSDEEGFPNTFLQAWSSGTPVVSLTVDPDGVIEQEGLGARAGSIDGAIVALNALMDSPRRRDDIGARAVRRVATVHGEASVAEAFNLAVRRD